MKARTEAQERADAVAAQRTLEQEAAAVKGVSVARPRKPAKWGAIVVTAALIDAAIAGLEDCGAAVCAVPVNDTVKRADETSMVRSTVSRQNLWLVQTPQAFHVDLLREAHLFSDIEATDGQECGATD